MPPQTSHEIRDREWRLRRLLAARLYLCTDLQRFLGTDGRLDERALSRFYDDCYRGGVDIIQVRDKWAEVQNEVRALDLLTAAATRHDALSATNDRADLALLTGTDVFHAGQTDLTAAQARSLLGDSVLLGRSCRTRAHVDTAAADPEIDYFCTGPVWETPTKPGRAAVGTTLPSYAAGLPADQHTWRGGPDPKPFFAIGGIDAHNVHEVTAVGANRIVVVRAIAHADDPCAAAAELLTAITEP